MFVMRRWVPEEKFGGDLQQGPHTWYTCKSISEHSRILDLEKLTKSAKGAKKLKTERSVAFNTS